MIVPVEISDSIIDDLCEDREALYACSLTCHLFRERAQHHLFRSIALSGADERAVQNLGDALTASPQLTQNIHHVDIPIELHGCDAFLEHSPLPNINTLTLHDPTGMSCNTAELPTTAFENAFPGVSSLSIENVGFMSTSTLVSLLLSFPRLAHLRLSSLYFNPDPRIYSVTPSPSSGTLSLTSLELHNLPTPKEYEWFVDRSDAFDMQDLRRLAFWYREEYTYSKCPTLSAGALAAYLEDTLEDLAIDAVHCAHLQDVFRHYQTQRRSHTRTLRTLRMCVMYTSNTQACLVRMINLLRANNLDARTEITLGALASSSAYESTWDPVTDAIAQGPFPWKCSIIIMRHVDEILPPLDALISLGVTVMEQKFRGPWIYS